MENPKPAIPLSSDHAPLYSSVTKDHVYKAPKTAKEALEERRAKKRDRSLEKSK